MELVHAAHPAVEQAVHAEAMALELRGKLLVARAAQHAHRQSHRISHIHAGAVAAAAAAARPGGRLQMQNHASVCCDAYFTSSYGSCQP